MVSRHVAGKINIGLDRTVWAGDSDNDLQMLETHGALFLCTINVFTGGLIMCIARRHARNYCG